MIRKPRRSSATAPALLISIALLCTAASAADPTERLGDPAREAHARALFREIRCLVCQNESIDDSDADLASDLRRIVRHQVSSGRSDAEIRTYLTDRYGEFVLLKPRFSLGNALLWLSPFAVLITGGAVLMLRRREDPLAEPPLSGDEEVRVARLADRAGGDTLSPQMRPDNVPEHGGNVS